jgi:AAA+ superfamily predicted ATPase
MDQLLFDDIIEYPDSTSEEKYNSLIGLDDIKNRLVKETTILLNPSLLTNWSTQKYGKIIPVLDLFNRRNSLFIFAGDVGTGKTTLAESFGDYLSRMNNMPISLYSLSLSTRGFGKVGDISRLVLQAFSNIKTDAKQLITSSGSFTGACIFLIDEADSLVQSRDSNQMQHEDRAGVNSFIQGLDSFTKYRYPIVTIICTNRLSTIDPAVRRRSADTFEFNRPDHTQRMALFRSYLSDLNLREEDFQTLITLTDRTEQRSYGYSYSDIIQKILPQIVMDSFPNDVISMEKILHILEKIPPTPPIN